ncbi:hypothetical protein Tb927.4.4780 [Trypanosoma brucei brucei TREU927]|uniref:Uncharacterized protein n=1 Tax=Trypanosoma brucei brucei (strain 927/4 GUTat10.1) TaxID=185431 RepID=Q583G3_TRYB2|nr:hypothetical protein Tb927.4.4780 [Trypanosoma brucei brucei TREU927]AAX80492.1 hypothetical protein Tb927.4.4780 [Trypanosoma brucei]AAZ11068.1 hypothetical protein Tb927.4.4780 [Trypanosoma brucei brucei TREU927]
MICVVHHTPPAYHSSSVTLSCLTFPCFFVTLYPSRRSHMETRLFFFCFCFFLSLFVCWFIAPSLLSFAILLYALKLVSGKKKNEGKERKERGGHLKTTCVYLGKYIYLYMYVSRHAYTFIYQTHEMKEKEKKGNRSVEFVCLLVSFSFFKKKKSDLLNVRGCLHLSDCSITPVKGVLLRLG